MKQFWLGLGLVGIILVSGLLLDKVLENRHQPQAKDLERAAACAREEDWPQAQALVKRAQRSWAEARNLTAATVNHSFVDGIDVRLAELMAYAQERKCAEFCAGCASLAVQLRNLSQTHSFSWWNLL